MLGCGTDEILHLINQTFLEPGDNIVQGQYAFGAYGIGARACQAEVRSAAEPNYRIDVDAMLALVDERTRLMFITNPANPTGTFTTAGRAAPPARRPAAQRGAGGRRRLRRVLHRSHLHRRPRPGARRREHHRHPHLLQAARPGGAAGRLGLRPGADRRRHRPHPPAVQRLHPGPRRRRRGAGGRGVPGAVAGPRRAVAAVADPAARRPRPRRRALGAPTSSWSSSRRRRARPRRRPRPSWPRAA